MKLRTCTTSFNTMYFEGSLEVKLKKIQNADSSQRTHLYMTRAKLGLQHNRTNQFINTIRWKNIVWCSQALHKEPVSTWPGRSQDYNTIEPTNSSIIYDEKILYDVIKLNQPAWNKNSSCFYLIFPSPWVHFLAKWYIELKLWYSNNTKIIKKA
jgi:hypothetical protein